MPLWFERAAESGLAFGAILAAATAVLAIAAYLLRRRNTPEQRERRRRLEIGRQGRLVSGVVLDVDDALQLHYQYKIAGVSYSACQDVSALDELIGDDHSAVVGAAQVKIHRKNPYNSIVVCEEWSGLRRGLPAKSEAANGLQ